MLRYILVTFFFLGWAFYEASGGSEFTEQLQTKRALAEAERQAAETQAAEIDKTAEPVVTDAMVTRAAFDPTEMPEPAAQTVAPTITPEPASVQPTPPEATEAAVTQEEAPQDIRSVKGTRVNMRNGPSTTYNVIMRLTRGTRVRILQEPGNGWVKLKVEDTGRIGWMASRLLTPAQG